MSLTEVTYSMVKGAPLNVLDYGAVSGADCTAAINAAIAAAGGAPVGGLYRNGSVLMVRIA